MFKLFAIASFLALAILHVSATSINTAGTPTTCGINTCCIPQCNLDWTDSEGCSGQAEITGSCSNAFESRDGTSQTGVDICDGANAFFCTTGAGNKVVFVTNKQNAVSAALFPNEYDECTLSGQCAPCDSQGSCAAPVYVGDIHETQHCKSLNDVLDASSTKLQSCG